jgi:ribosome-associated translation inhibitor RaiA
MTVNVHTVHFDADAKLIEHVEKKVAKLSHYARRCLSEA